LSGRILAVRAETWPLKSAFTISRGSKTEARLVVCEISQSAAKGWGECVPYAHYGESVQGVQRQIEAMAGDIQDGMDRWALLGAMKPGAARNALDCALWDLEAKLAGKRAWELAGLAPPGPVVTADTIALGTEAEMEAAAAARADRPLLKVKLDDDDVIERMRAVARAAPNARLIADANEGWSLATLTRTHEELALLGVETIEQPLPAGADGPLADFTPSIPLCADESCLGPADLSGLADRYQMVNIKLDKAGGLTEALRMVSAARAAGLSVMIGCMVGTSLAMAPATLLGPLAELVDLDGPLWLARDRSPGLNFSGGLIHPPMPDLWG
jgi:L-alanine-DL-glutamate epimerase-like enolase superfamily enzyme